MYIICQLSKLIKYRRDYEKENQDNSRQGNRRGLVTY
jgi:hypothetical protein